MTRHGSTLLEAVVAVSILSVVMVSAMGIVAQVVNGDARAQARIRGLHLSEQRLESIRSLEPEELWRSVGQTIEGRFLPPLSEFRWQMLLRDVDRRLGLMGVDVVVEWDGGRSRLSTVLYRPLQVGAQ